MHKMPKVLMHKMPKVWIQKMPNVWVHKIPNVWMLKMTKLLMHKMHKVLMHKMPDVVKALDAYCVNAQYSWRVSEHFRRHPEEFQSCKEVQTEMTGMDLQELNEDIMIQLYGVDYVDVSCDLSFKMLHKLVTSHNSVQLKPVDLRCCSDW